LLDRDAAESYLRQCRGSGWCYGNGTWHSAEFSVPDDVG